MIEHRTSNIIQPITNNNQFLNRKPESNELAMFTRFPLYSFKAQAPNKITRFHNLLTILSKKTQKRGIRPNEGIVEWDKDLFLGCSKLHTMHLIIP